MSLQMKLKQSFVISHMSLQDLLRYWTFILFLMDPEEWLRKYASRLDYVHFKDVNETVYREVLGEHIRFFEGCGKGSMCPIGKGTLNYPGIKKHWKILIIVDILRLSRNVIHVIQIQV